MPLLVRPATSHDDYAAIAKLVREYVAWLRARYAHDDWFITEVLDKQSLATELTSLQRIYGPPNGHAFVGVEAGVVRACGAYRRIDDATCEMKRVFVSPRLQGAGAGRRICGELIAAARADGYRAMKLDTGVLMKEAIALYRSLGFVECAPYLDYPDKLMPYFKFMALALAQAAPA